MIKVILQWLFQLSVMVESDRCVLLTLEVFSPIYVFYIECVIVRMHEQAKKLEFLVPPHP